MGIVTIGIDIGKKRDPTAIAVCEKEDRPSGRIQTITRTVYHHKNYRTIGDHGLITRVLDPHDEGEEVECKAEIMEAHFLVRHLERLPLQTPYPKVVKRIEEITFKIKEMEKEPLIYVDSTGVGQPVIDMMEASNIKGIIYAVYFTHGDRLSVQGYQFTLGKAYLVSRLQALLQSGRVHLPNTQESENLARELLDYEIHVDEKANDTYGAFKVGSHDDLVTALGLAVFYEPRRWGPV